MPNAPVLAPVGTFATGQLIDGIQCNSSEQVLFHIHTHLSIFVNGSAKGIPYGVGIPGAVVQSTSSGPYVGSGTCFYWLHTHAADGIIHIESPVQEKFTLGDFFDEWGITLGPNQVGPAIGRVTALYNGRVYLGNPRDIPLGAHTQIQLEVGRPIVAPEKISFPNGL